MKKALLFSALALVLAGCASQRCDKVQPYQETVAGRALEVPAGLSEPPMRSRAPQVEPNAPTRREDGRCLDEPPLSGTETPNDQGKGN